MSRLAFVLLALCLAVASAQWSDKAFTVVDSDRSCTLESDCTSTASGCCAGSDCSNFQAVNRASLGKYQTLLQAYISANCTAVLCAANVCSTPVVSCSSDKLCTLRSSVVPVPSPVPNFTVLPEDQLCSTARDCSFVGNTCCADSNCDYLPVNITAKPRYDELFSAYVSANCAATMCLARVCEAPAVDCVANNRGNVCVITKAPCNTVNCVRDPCDGASCAADPTATCRANYCGGCNFDFFDASGAKVDCAATDPCGGLPVVDCFRDPCEGTTCPSNPRATCRANYCGGCNYDYFDASGVKVDCTGTDPCNGLPVHECLRNPCDGTTCPSNPRATCEANYCGGCNYDYFDASGVKVDCNKTTTDPCNGLPVHECLRNPCDGAVCVADLTATCRANYCGGCNAEFFDEKGGKVDCNDVTDPICPEGVSLVNCVAEPCSVSKCGAFPNAPCRNNYCGGCNAEYLVNDQWVPCDSVVSPCPDGVLEVQCFVEPCATASCAAYPNAVCEDNYCGGCKPVFKVDGREVDCGANEPTEHTVCPPGVSEVQCFADPCSVTDCPAYPNADCKADYCGGCRAIFSVEGRRVNCDGGCVGLPCDQCLQKSTCKFCSGSYSVASDLTAPRDFGYCVAASSVNERACASSYNGDLMVAGSTCPSLPTDPTSDHAPLQSAIEAQPGLQKFVVVVSLIINETDGASALHKVKIFVDLFGSETPTDSDKVAVCSLLKTAFSRINTWIPVASLECALDEKISAKRDVSYVASLTYGTDNNQASASALVASLALLGLALLF